MSALTYSASGGTMVELVAGVSPEGSRSGTSWGSVLACISVSARTSTLVLELEKKEPASQQCTWGQLLGPYM